MSSIEIKVSQNSTISNVTCCGNKVSLNGKEYIVPENSSISVINNKLFINGKEYDKNETNEIVVKVKNPFIIFSQIMMVAFVFIVILSFVLH